MQESWVWGLGGLRVQDLGFRILRSEFVSLRVRCVLLIWGSRFWGLRWVLEIQGADSGRVENY